MAVRHMQFAEEDTYGSVRGSPSWLCFHFLSEGYKTTRDDYLVESVDKWVPDKRVEGRFKAQGPMDTLVDPAMWPKILVLFMGDPATTDANPIYTHIFKFGNAESVGGTGIKSFTVQKGYGIERDSRFPGTFVTQLTYDCIATDPYVASTVTLLGNGSESLVTAITADYSNYTQSFFSPAGDTQTFTIGETDRLTTDPKIEAFRMTLTRGYAEDYYRLGSRFIGGQEQDGFCSVEGSIDLSFNSEDEHERFLTAVGSYSAGDQASFALQHKLQGATLSGVTKYEVRVDIPECHWGDSDIPVRGKDRIVQKLNWYGMYNSTDLSAAKLTVINGTSSYTSLS